MTDPRLLLLALIGLVAIAATPVDPEPGAAYATPAPVEEPTSR